MIVSYFAVIRVLKVVM